MTATAIRPWSSPTRRIGSWWTAAGRNTASSANDAMLERAPTAYDEKIYGADWRAWVDPHVPDEIAPTTLLLARHLETPIAHKPAVIVDGEATSYRALAKRVADMSA